jgi:hypothetical protein
MLMLQSGFTGIGRRQSADGSADGPAACVELVQHGASRQKYEVPFLLLVLI